MRWFTLHSLFLFSALIAASSSFQFLPLFENNHRHAFSSLSTLAAPAPQCISGSRLITPDSNSLPHRFITELKAAAGAGGDDDSLLDMEELSRRIATLKASEETVRQVLSGTEGDRVQLLPLPVISFDALLPKQVLEGTTTDETFCQLLQELGLGGLFVMTSLNHAQRKIRRNGVICRITRMDAKQSSNRRVPTSIEFCISGQHRCRLVGPSEQMVARVGRWRREYDSDGEEAKLGWGTERFVDSFPNATSYFSTCDSETENENNDDGDETKPANKWSSSLVDTSLLDSDAASDEVLDKAKHILPLLDEWKMLASDLRTFENIHVTCTARIQSGQPELRVDPHDLIQAVEKGLGECPKDDATALALWGAALINPLPTLGASPEIRGRILEAPDAMSRLKILEWGIQRSIRNLDGRSPLI